MANKRPSYIEKKMQNATNRLWDCLADITNPNGVFVDAGTESGNCNKNSKNTGSIQARPKQVQLNDVKIWVVSKENYDEFVKEYAKKNGGDSYIALSIKDYENLSLNFAELRRYIEQQKQIIIYYENAVKPEENGEKK